MRRSAGGLGKGASPKLDAPWYAEFNLPGDLRFIIGEPFAGSGEVFVDRFVQADRTYCTTSKSQVAAVLFPPVKG